MDPKIFDTLLEPTFLLNKEKKIIYCNETAALLADSSVRKLQRAQPVFDEYFQFETPLESLKSLAQLKDASPYQEVKFHSVAGKDGKVQVTVQPFEVIDDQPTSWLVFFRDVTLEETLQKKYRGELEQKEGYIRELEQARAALENYSKNLEKMVQERTAELSRLNQLMTALLDSLGQGFFIFDQDGKVLEIASKACQTTVECDPRGQLIWKTLALNEKQVPGFQKWMTTLFAEMLPFEDLAPLGPPRFPHSEGREIELQYYPLRSGDGMMEGVVVVATDITSLVQAQREAEFERSNAKMILQLIRNKRQVASFIRESEQLLLQLSQEMNQQEPDPELTFRLLHTLKGGSATFSIRTLSDECHEAENLLSEWKSTKTPALLNQLQEKCKTLPLHFNRFLNDNEPIIGKIDKLSERWTEAPVSQFVQFANKHFPTLLQEQVKVSFFEQFLFEPVGSFFTHYDEALQNVAVSLGKELSPLHLKNPDFRILPEAYEPLFTSLMHAFRNAVDHGIESPEVRAERGKPTAGNISVAFELNGHQLFIRIADDGNGVDPQKIRQRLESKGLSTSGESDQQVIQHIFDSQFSTRDQVTDLSGRGVGMDAIQTAAHQLGGKAWVESKLGQGTELFIQVPWIIELQSKLRAVA